MTNIRAGDLVVCVEEFDDRERASSLGIRVGRSFRVTASFATNAGEWFWLRLAGVAHPGVKADHFRKIDKAEDQFTQTVRACKPIKQREPA